MAHRDPLLRRQIAEHRRLLLVGAAHKTILRRNVLSAKPFTYFFSSLLVAFPNRFVPKTAIYAGRWNAQIARASSSKGPSQCHGLTSATKRGRNQLKT